MSAGLGWATGTARPNPERAARAERRAGRMADGWGSNKAVVCLCQVQDDEDGSLHVLCRWG